MKRYYVFFHYGEEEIRERPDGEWVKYKDVEEIFKKIYVNRYDVEVLNEILFEEFLKDAKLTIQGI